MPVMRSDGLPLPRGPVPTGRRLLLRPRELRRQVSQVLPRTLGVVRKMSEKELFVVMDMVSPTGGRFRVKTDGETMRVFPMEGFSLHDFMAFYEIVTEVVDPDAEVVP